MPLKPFLKICLSGLLLLTTSVPLQSASTAFFPQSVASGDPRPDRVILWTRVVDLEREGEDLPLTLSVAADPEFASVLMTREGLVARAAHDGCVKVEVPGLAPGTHYWYRFTYRGSETSPVGRTKTAPAPDQSETVRFAFLNCQDYVGRYYNTLAHLVQWEADSLDFIVHLGDYVYETTGDPGFQTPGEGRSIVFGDSEGVLDLGGFQAARSSLS